MKIQEYFKRSRGNSPKAGVIGVESGWMDVGTISLPHGTLWAGDPRTMERRGPCGFALRVPRGNYRIQIKGIDFEGHRRTARVRAVWENAGKTKLGRSIGKTGTDIGCVGLCDYEAYKAAVAETDLEYFESDMDKAIGRERIGIHTFKYDGKPFEMALQPSGLGDGTFKVYPLKAKGETVGMEVEFLTPEAEARGPVEDEMEWGPPWMGSLFLRAIKKGDLRTVKEMMGNNYELAEAKGTIESIEAATPLHFAVIYGRTEIAETLLLNPYFIYPVDQLDGQERTPLMRAVMEGDVDMVRLLLKYGAAVNAQDRAGRTPLHWAALAMPGQAKIVKLLLAKRANAKARDHSGKRPIDLARQYEGVEQYRDGQNDLKKILAMLRKRTAKGRRRMP